jgi:hypothetical protein
MTRKWRRSQVNFLLLKTYKRRRMYDGDNDHCNYSIDSNQTSLCNPNNHIIISGNFQPENSKLLFFRILPPVKSYFNILEALRILNNLNNSDYNKDGHEFKFSSLKDNNIGFTELTKVINKEFLISGEIEELRIEEKEASASIGFSPDIVRTLIALTNGAKSILVYAPFNPIKPITDLKEMAENELKSELAKGLIILFLLWVFLTLITELPIIKLWY